VPVLKAQDDGRATKTHAEVALGRSDDPRGIGDHYRVRVWMGFEVVSQAMLLLMPPP
jgi:hypothetical protein